MDALREAAQAALAALTYKGYGSKERFLKKQRAIESLRSALAQPAAPDAQPQTKVQRVHALVNGGPFPGMSEAFDAHMGAACWADPGYAPDASTWAAAWKAAQAAQPAPQPLTAVVYPPDGTVSPFTVINLGAGKVQMGDCIHDGRLPALWFGKNGQGMGHEEVMNRMAHEGETLAVVTFSNVEGLDVLIDVIERIRRVSFPDAAAPASVEAADAARYRWLTEDHADPEQRQCVRDITERMAVMSYSSVSTSIDAAMALGRKGDSNG
jgi:hypothetical protein